MASVVEIFNLAIAHLGSGKDVASIDELSSEAKVCRKYYQTALEETLRGFSWPFANRYETLNLISEDPNDEWSYLYRYPVNCLQAVRIVSGNPNEASSDRIPYKISSDSLGRLIYSNQENAVLEFVAKIEDVSLFPGDFKIALSFKLAHYIAPTVTKGDPFKMGERAINSYFFEISNAKAAAINEEQPDSIPDSEFVRTRL